MKNKNSRYCNENLKQHLKDVASNKSPDWENVSIQILEIQESRFARSSGTEHQEMTLGLQEISFLPISEKGDQNLCGITGLFS